MDREIWYSTEEAAQAVGGVSTRWIRVQIEAGRLRARVLLTGQRATYRIRASDLLEFIRTYIVEDAREREP